MSSIHFFIIRDIIINFFSKQKALASERELVLVLLNPNAMINIGPTANQFSDSSKMHASKTEHDTTFVLDRIFEGACRPFKVRVDQVLQSQPTLIVSYKLSNTLEFYNHTVRFYSFISFCYGNILLLLILCLFF